MLAFMTRLSAVLLLALLPGSVLLAREIPNPDATPEQQAMEILHKYAEAIGGLERIREVKSISSLAEIELKRAGDPHGRPFTIIDSLVEVYPDRSVSYTSMVGGDKSMVSVTVGDRGWRIRNGVFEEKEESEIADSRASLQASTIPILSALDDPYYEVSYVGEETIAGRDLLKLEFELPGGEKFAWYVDPADFLVYAEHDFYGDSPGFIFIGGYEEFDGLMIPVSAAFQGEKGSMSFTLYWLEINAAYDSSAFKRPKN